MLIDCDRCAVRGDACYGCPVSALFDTPDGITGLQAAELRAIEVIETAGFDVELLETPPLPRQAPVPRQTPAPWAAPVPVRLVLARRRDVA
jgi:hypothetical protein